MILNNNNEKLSFKLQDTMLLECFKLPMSFNSVYSTSLFTTILLSFSALDHKYNYHISSETLFLSYMKWKL